MCSIQSTTKLCFHNTSLQKIRRNNIGNSNASTFSSSRCCISMHILPITCHAHSIPSLSSPRCKKLYFGSPLHVFVLAKEFLGNACYNVDLNDDSSVCTDGKVRSQDIDGHHPRLCVERLIFCEDLHQRRTSGHISDHAPDRARRLFS